VSRQIASLEQDLQVPVFVRGTRGLRLTAEGAQLARTVAAAFDMLRTAVGQVRQSGPASALRISVPPSMAMWWLIPRLGALHQAHPRLRIELTTSIEPVDFEGDPYDAAIRRIARDPKGLNAQRFVDARPIPVCSPAYQKQQRLRSTSDLARATLIFTRSEPEAWSRWLKQRGVSVEAGAPTLTFEQLYFALQGALDSLGVALAPASLVADEITRGRLVSLAEPQGPLSPSYALIWPRVTTKREAIETLAEWLKAAR
jgi:LysR family glycine cleavage system transcriptional activator